MFQYASARSLALRLKQKLYLDLRFLEQNKETAHFTARSFSLDIFEIKIRKFRLIYNNSLLPGFIKRWIGMPPKPLHVYSDGCNLTNVKLPVYLDGYFQSEFFFRHERLTLLKEFSFKLQADDINKSLIRDILSTTSVSIHFRRGDYVNKDAVAQVHGTCSLDYYETALSLLTKKYASLVFYVFTDDPEWVKNHFISPNINKYDIVLVNNNHGVDSWKDMYLMSICKHNIIANSSFSWWGAWLNQNSEKTVIAPTRWFADEKVYAFEKDIVPDSWIKI
jgi:hypothetical protein